MRPCHESLKTKHSVLLLLLQRRGATANEVLFPPPLFPFLSLPTTQFGSFALSFPSVRFGGQIPQIDGMQRRTSKRAQDPSRRPRQKKASQKTSPRDSLRDNMRRSRSQKCSGGIPIPARLALGEKKERFLFSLLLSGLFFLFSSEGGVGSIFASFLTAVLRGGGGLAEEEKPAIC